MSFPSKHKLRSSGLLFSLVLSIIFGLIPYILHNEIRIAIYILCIVLCSISIISPYSLRTPYALWIKFGLILGKINSNLVLSLFFYLILTPAAIIRISFRYLIKIFSKEKRSYYSKIQLSTTIDFKDQI